MNQNFNQNGFQQNQNFNQNQQQGFGQNNQQQNFQQPQQNFQQQGGGMFVDNNQAPSAGNGVLPKGQYPVRVTNAEYKQNSAGTGWILALENTVTAGLFAGRKIFDNYNMQHTNETAQNIGQANYAKLCQSIYGTPNNRPQNPAALIGTEYVIDYGAQKKKSNNNTYQPDAEENNDVQMEVKDRLPLSAYHAATQPQQQAQQQVMTQQAFGQQQPNNQHGNFQQQTNQPGQQQSHNQQQQPQQNFNQQQVQQPQNQQFNQQQGFPQQTADAAGAGNQQAGNNQGGFVQGTEVQGQNGNGQGNGAPQGDNSANGNPGNVNQTPFNQGAANGFGGGFGQM